MPIKGQLLYLMRWWYRATVENSAPVPSNPPALPPAPVSASSATPSAVKK